MSYMRLSMSMPDMCNQFAKARKGVHVYKQPFEVELSEKLESLLLNESTEDLDTLTEARDLDPSMEAQETHKSVHVQQQSFAEQLSKELESLLLDVTTADLDVLTNMRDQVVAKCLQLEEQKKRESVVQVLPVVLVDDGDQPSADLKVVAEWSVGRVLGQGRFATVYQAKGPSGRQEAMKVIIKGDYCADEDREVIINEYEALQKISHRNIAAFTGAVESKNHVYLFTEFAKGKDLFDFLKVRQQNKTKVTKEAIASVTASMASALSHCHSKGICHRDLKPENIMIEQDYSAKLVDFGCACDRYKLGVQCTGTMPFIAPECLFGTAVDGASADVWSLGVIILEMHYGLRALSKALGWDTEPSSTEACGKHILFQKLGLSALTGAVGWGEDVGSSEACGAQLLELFANPEKGLEVIRASLGISEQNSVNDEGVLASMLDANPAKRPEAEALLKGMNRV